MDQIPTDPAPGEARCPRGPTTQEVIHRDGRPVPPAFEQTAPRFLGDEDIPFERYTSRAVFDREMASLWTRTWQWACREEHIRRPGDYFVYDVGDHSILIVRDQDMSVKAYVNACLHRGTKLRPSHTDGHMPEIRCRFHGWTWTLGGELKRVVCPWDAPHVTAERFALPQVRVGLWGGFVFVNMDENAPPLLEYLAPLPDHFAAYGMERRYIEIHIEKELFCNWKAGFEAFIENYHTQETHPQLLTANYDEPTQYDIFTPFVSRFLSAYGVSSPHLRTPLTEHELVEEMLVGDRTILHDLKVGDGETARIALARTMRRVLGEVYRTDLTRFTDTEMIDVAQYSLFPNMILFPGLSLPFVYRFRPIGTDPDRCLFELLSLRERPDAAAPPPPAEPVRLKEADSFTSVPGFDPILGRVFDQDTDNLRAQQEGFKTSRKKGQTLLNYQEVRIRHHHQTLDRYL